MSAGVTAPAGGHLPHATSFNIGAAARGYGVELIDYGRDYAGPGAHGYRGGGLLVHNGTGLALAVMDSVAELRWVLDLSGLKAPVPGKLRWFLDCASQMSTLTVVALVFFGDEPDAARDLLHHLSGPVVEMGNADVGLAGRAERVGTFEELESACSRVGSSGGH